MCLKWNGSISGEMDQCFEKCFTGKMDHFLEKCFTGQG